MEFDFAKFSCGPRVALNIVMHNLHLNTEHDPVFEMTSREYSMLRDDPQDTINLLKQILEECDNTSWYNGPAVIQRAIDKLSHLGHLEGTI